MNEEIEIRALLDDDDIPAITALLHDAYAPLAAMGFRYLASHQDDVVTRQRLHQGLPFVAVMSSRIIATITLRPSNPDSECSWYRETDVFTFGQFGVLPSLQRCGIGLRLMDMIEQEATKKGARALALDTCEGANHLCRWYSRLGYDFIQHISWHDTNYRSVVLSKPLHGAQNQRIEHGSVHPLPFPK